MQGGKIGKQALRNRLEMMDCVDFDWIGQDLTDDVIGRQKPSEGLPNQEKNK